MDNNYVCSIRWNSSEPYDPTNDALEVIIAFNMGQRHILDFVTKKFIDEMFEKNKRTGECASGKYFTMPGMIVVENLSLDVIRATIDDLIKNKELELYLQKY